MKIQWLNKKENNWKFCEEIDVGGGGVRERIGIY